MLPQVKQGTLKRLNYIEGHLSGVKRMVEEDKYCVDILKQTYAIRRAIEKVEAMLLEGHLDTCVVDGIRSGRDKEVLEELMELYSLANK
jgi:DNA-binding FrmR family transcriptional regulator